MIFNKAIDRIQGNKQKKLRGDYVCIPWLFMPKLASVVPGVLKAKYVGVTANSKVGKTQLCDWLFVLAPFNFIYKYKPNIRLKIFYFSLEVDKVSKMLKFISNSLYLNYRERYSTGHLESLFGSKVLPDSVEEKILELEDYFKSFEESVTIIDNVRTADEIFKYVENYAHNTGKYKNKDGDVIPPHVFKTMLPKEKESVSYLQDDEDEFVLVIVDHLSLLIPNRGETKHETIGKFSSEYAINMRNVWGYSPIAVQQQASDVERKQYTYKGDNIVDKLKPTPDGLGDNKMTQRDFDLLLGLFSPSRYSIDTYEDFDLTRLKDSYREMSILLNRGGEGLAAIDLYFDGATNFFKEMPSADLLSESDYRNIQTRNINI